MPNHEPTIVPTLPEMLEAGRAELERASSSSSSSGETTRATWAELDEACSAMGGARGIPQLIAMVSAMLPGGNGLPPSWATWLDARIAERGPVTLTCETPSGAWRLELR